MLRALFTGISGLNAHQELLDVTANNIANVNTTGYESNSVVFQDALSQTLTGAAAAGGSQGGVNPQQVGLGVTVGGTELNTTQGSAQQTGKPLDLMINGDGYFAVQKNGQTLYTRAGSFHLDSSGDLVTPDGGIVLGSDGNPLALGALQDGTDTSYTIDQSGDITGVASDGTSTVLGQIGIATFPNPDGLAKVGDTEFNTTVSSGDATIQAPNTGEAGYLTSGQLEMSNVNLSTELTNLIIAERGYQANSKVVTTSDEILQTLVQLKS